MVFIFKLSVWVSLLFSCRMQDPEISNKIIDSVEYQESHGKFTVKDNGKCIGLMQIDSRYVSLPANMLRMPVVNRVVGVRAIKYWNKRAGGNLRLALSSYNCGTKGLEGKCGIGYANAVMGRNLSYSRTHLPQCMLISQYINWYLDNVDKIKNKKKSSYYSWLFKARPIQLHPHHKRRS